MKKYELLARAFAMQVMSKQLFRVMRVTTFFLLIGCMHLSAASLSQTVTLRAKDQSLQQIFEGIEKQTGYWVVYSDWLISQSKPITIDANEMALTQFLDQVLKPQSLTYAIEEKNILIMSSKDRVTSRSVRLDPDKLVNAPLQQRVIQGKVTDEDGNPLQSVTVSIKDTRNVALTDGQGNYKIETEGNNTVLVFTIIGYIDNEQVIGNRTTIDVVLAESVSDLDEVVVVGYGTQKKINLTGAVSTVDAQTIEKRQVMNVGQALQGVVPGVNLVSNSLGGELNNTLNIDVRGMGTIGAGSSASPLILIDGAQGDMNAINPKDIQNITILKDAAASSIYGSRAAFGVILITTKKGTAGKTAISYSSNVRFDGLLNAPQTMGGEKYIQYINRSSTNEGSAPAFSDIYIDRFNAYMAGDYVNSPDSYWNDPGLTNYGEWRDLIGNTDWYNTFFKNWTPSQEHNLSASGGSEKVTFRLSAGYLDQKGKLRYGKDNFDRYTLAAKIGANLSDWAKLNYSSSWIRNSYDRPAFLNSFNGRWFLHNTTRASPLTPVEDPNGKFTSGSGIIQLTEGGRALDAKDVLTQQMQLVLEPAKNWRITAEGNLITTTTNSHQDILPVYRHNAFGEQLAINWDYWNAVGIAQVKEISTGRNYYSTNIFTDYTLDLSAGHHFKFLAGVNSEYEKFKGLTAQRDGLLSIEVPTIGMTTTNPQIFGDLMDWANTGVFGRINYNYKERYLLEANGRYDGSSRFIGDKRWGFFPSFSAGWNVANEEFFSPLRGKIDLLKVRGSWGALGNMNTNNLYPFYLTMPIGISNGGWLVDGQRPNVASAPGLVSSLLTWEKVSSFNIGLDWSALEHRFTGAFDYFQRYTNGMVGPAPQLPSTLGTAVPSVNNTDMKSMGFEIELAWRDKIGEVGYSVKVLLANDKQIINNYPNEIMNFDNWYSGKVNGEIWSFDTKGLAQTDAEMAAHLASLPNGGQGYFGSNWAAGDIMYADINGDGRVDKGAGTVANPGDMHIIGNSNPRFKTGFNLDVYWRNFDFSMFWAGVLKRDYLIGNAEANSQFWGANANVSETFALTEHWDFWRPAGDVLGANPNGYYPRPLYNYKNKHAQSRYLLNAAYMRLKNIQVGYTLPTTVSEKMNISSVRVFVSGENLLTITKLSTLLDPEVLGGRWGPGQTYPMGKTFAAGLSINF